MLFRIGALKLIKICTLQTPPDPNTELDFGKIYILATLVCVLQLAQCNRLYSMQ